MERVETELDSLSQIIKGKKELNISQEVTELQKKLKIIKENKDTLEKIKKEVLRMKKGSIALVNQITSISKIRIYDPKRNGDVLSNIKLSNEKLDLIDKQIGENFSNLIK